MMSTSGFGRAVIRATIAPEVGPGHPPAGPSMVRKRATMPWIEATLRGQRVLAKAKADGTLVVEGGRVEIRYNPKDGRAYRAAARNLEILPGGKLLSDEACEPAAGAPAGATGPRPVAAPAQPAGAWVAYTDGACSGNPGPAGSGVVLVSPKGKMFEGFEY